MAQASSRVERLNLHDHFLATDQYLNGDDGPQERYRVDGNLMTLMPVMSSLPLDAMPDLMELHHAVVDPALEAGNSNRA